MGKHRDEDERPPGWLNDVLRTISDGFNKLENAMGGKGKECCSSSVQEREESDDLRDQSPRKKKRKDSSSGREGGVKKKKKKKKKKTKQEDTASYSSVEIVGDDFQNSIEE
eukprot:667793-Rhodomonas_salina.2